MNKKAYQKYKNTAVESASREKLLLMMYEGAIRFVKKAILAVDEDNIAARGQNIGHAFDIIVELNNTLNHEVGGTLASDLENLYMFLTDQLTQANINSDRKALENVLGILQTLYDGWKQAIESLKREELDK